MGQEPSSHGYLRLLRYTFFALLFIIAGAFLYLPNYSKLKKLRGANKRLSNDIEQLEDEIKDLKRKYENVEIDPYIIEEIVRDDLGMVKENEIVVDIQE